MRDPGNLSEGKQHGDRLLPKGSTGSPRRTRAQPLDKGHSGTWTKTQAVNPSFPLLPVIVGDEHPCLI